MMRWGVRLGPLGQYGALQNAPQEDARFAHYSHLLLVTKGNAKKAKEVTSPIQLDGNEVSLPLVATSGPHFPCRKGGDMGHLVSLSTITFPPIHK